MDALALRTATGAFYDTLSAEYGHAVFFGTRRAAVLRMVAAELAGARTVLDLGCANGPYDADLLAAYPALRIVGLDLGPAMLRAARARLGNQAAWIQGDATTLPFQPETFDVILMANLLLLWTGPDDGGDLRTCLAEAARCLKPGGVIIATLSVTHWPNTVRQLLGDDLLPLVDHSFRVGHQQPDRSGDEARAEAAVMAVGLQPEWRRGPVTMPWRAADEWARLSWGAVVHEPQRKAAALMLSARRPFVGDRTVELSETLLLAHKPGTT